MEYKVGEEVELKITGIKEYGVFGITKDDITGLIHISNIRKINVEDPSDYFTIGDRITGKVVRIENGKLGVSTVDYYLPSEKKEETNEPEDSKEIYEIFSYLEQLLGEDLSRKAKKEIKETIKKNGLFKYTLGLSKQQIFKIDKGIAFNEFIKKEIERDFRKYKFQISDHAVEQWTSNRFGENPVEKADLEILHNLLNGVLVSEKEDHIYIKNGDLVFPCVNVDLNTYKVKTVLTEDLFYRQLINDYK